MLQKWFIYVVIFHKLSCHAFSMSCLNVTCYSKIDIHNQFGLLSNVRMPEMEWNPLLFHFGAQSALNLIQVDLYYMANSLAWLIITFI